MAYTYEHPKPSVTTDCVVFGLNKEEVSVLFIKRGKEPFKDLYAIPGGFLAIDEVPDKGAKRELEEETSLKVNEIYQIGAFGDVNRDPRGRIISIAFVTVLKKLKPVQAASDAKEAVWINVNQLPKMAFDHDKILKKGAKRVHDLLNSWTESNAVFGLSSEEVQIIKKQL